MAATNGVKAPSTEDMRHATSFRERMTQKAQLLVHERATSEDKEAMKIIAKELPGKCDISASDRDPYDIRPRLYAGRGSVYRGVDQIRDFFASIRALEPFA